MIIYGVDMPPPLTKSLKKDVPGCNQPWYADNTGTVGSFDNITIFLVYYLQKGRHEDISPSRQSQS